MAEVVDASTAAAKALLPGARASERGDAEARRGGGARGGGAKDGDAASSTRPPPRRRKPKPERAAEPREEAAAAKGERGAGSQVAAGEVAGADEGDGSEARLVDDDEDAAPPLRSQDGEELVAMPGTRGVASSGVAHLGPTIRR